MAKVKTESGTNMERKTAKPGGKISISNQRYSAVPQNYLHVAGMSLPDILK